MLELYIAILMTLGRATYNCKTNLFSQRQCIVFGVVFSLSKNWMHNVVWGCAEILPRHLSTIKELCNSNRREELRNATRGSKKARHEKGTEFFYTKADGLNISFSQVSVENLTQDIIFSETIHKFKLVLVTNLLSKVSIEFLSVVVTVKPLLDQSFVVCKIINHENRSLNCAIAI